MCPVICTYSSSASPTSSHFCTPAPSSPRPGSPLPQGWCVLKVKILRLCSPVTSALHGREQIHQQGSKPEDALLVIPQLKHLYFIRLFPGDPQFLYQRNVSNSDYNWHCNKPEWGGTLSLELLKSLPPQHPPLGRQVLGEECTMLEVLSQEDHNLNSSAK